MLLKTSHDNKPIILIIDDERVNINILNDVLKDDYLLKVAINSNQAIEMARSEPIPDIMLLDIVMPDMDGFEVCKIIKRTPGISDIPIIFITAKDSEQDEVYGLELGAVDFISKPIRPAIVKARVKNHITILHQKRKLEQMHQKVLLLSRTDGLTGVSNRRNFYEFLEQEWLRCMCLNMFLGLLMIDIDFFKIYNDYYGNAVGDNCLKEIAHTLESQVKRPVDLLARYGGEEFACVLPYTNLEGVIKVGDAILEAVRSLKIEHVQSKIEQIVTVSIGVKNCY